MALLIDPPSWPGHGRWWSHLISDLSFEELHAFAASLGIPERGFEGDHYDVPQEHYARTVAAGATPVPSRDLLRRLHETGLRRPKRVGERVVASRILPAGRGRLDTLVSVRTPRRPVSGVVLLVVAASGDRLLARPGDLVPAAAVPAGTSVDAVAAALAARTLTGPAAGRLLRQVGYLRHLGAGVGAVRIDVVLQLAVPPDRGPQLPKPPRRWVPAATVARAQPALAPLITPVRHRPGG